MNNHQALVADDQSLGENSAMLTSAQIRAARALLKLSAEDLATKCGLHRATILRAESSDEVIGVMSVRNLLTIKQTLESAGVIFIESDGTAGPGVRLKR